MGWNGSGGYVRAENFSADSSAGIKILATRMDTELDDFASAMTLCLTRNGQNSPTANIPMAGYRLTNVGVAASVEDYMRVKEHIRDVPVYARDSGATTGVVRVSVPFYVSVSAGQSPPDGARLRVLTSVTKSDLTCSMNLYTPLNTSAGAQPHVAPIWTRGHKYDPAALRAGKVYEFVYDASASGWNCLNPSRSYYLVDCRAKATDTNGTVAGRASASSNVFYSRLGNHFSFGTTNSVSVSCSISARYLIFSVSNVTSQTSGAAGNAGIPITVKDLVSQSWGAQVLLGQVYGQALFNTAGTTVSVACTIRAAPFTISLFGQS